MEEEWYGNFRDLRPHLANEWKGLERYLHISEDELLRVSKEYEDRISEYIYQMLLCWKLKNGDAATPDKLIEALKKLHRNDLAYKLEDVYTRHSKEKDWTPDKQLGDSLMFLGRTLLREWKDVGRYLHISEDIIFRLHKECKDVAAESIYQVLLYWQRKNGDTPDKLIEALKKSDGRYLAKKLAGIYTRRSKGKDWTPDKQLGDSLMAVGKVSRSQSEGEYRTSEEDLRWCFLSLKRNIYADWKDLATYLDISEKELSHLREEYEGERSELFYQMLLFWQRKNGDTATPDKLIEALKTSGREDLAEKLADLSTRHSKGKDWTPGDSLMNFVKVTRSQSEGKYRIMDKELRQCLMNFAQYLCAEWKDLGRYLGISEDELLRIREEYEGDSKEMGYQMLLSLQRKNNFISTPEKLTVALTDMGGPNFAGKFADIISTIDRKGKEWTPDNQLGDPVMADIFTYSKFKETLASSLQTDDCMRLTSFFRMPKDQTEAILSSDTPPGNFLLAMEEKGVLQPHNVEKLTEAFVELKMNMFCRHVVEIYQKTRGALCINHTLDACINI